MKKTYIAPNFEEFAVVKSNILDASIPVINDTADPTLPVQSKDYMGVDFDDVDIDRY